jgi:hypothetical protein
MKIDVPVERRRCLGLPPEVLAAAGIAVGERVRLHVKDSGYIEVVQVRTLLGRYTGAVPGLTAATDLGDLRSQ